MPRYFFESRREERHSSRRHRRESPTRRSATGGDHFESRREDRHSSRHHRRESPLRRSATERRSSNYYEPHDYGYEYTTSDHVDDGNNTPYAEAYIFEASPRNDSSEHYCFSPRSPSSEHYHFEAPPRTPSCDPYIFEAAPRQDTAPGYGGTHSRSRRANPRPNDYPTSPGPEHEEPRHSRSWRSHPRTNDYRTSAGPEYEATPKSHRRGANSRQQSSYFTADDSADDPTLGVNINVVALIFVGIAFTFAEITDLQQKILHMVRFLECWSVVMAEEKVETIFHYMYNERAKNSKRFTIPDTDRIGEFEKSTGLRKYWVMEGHRRFRTH